MARSRYTLIVSDLHLGFGPTHADGSKNILEEFYYDGTFAEWLHYYCEGEYARAGVTLILNGDILNHLHAMPDEPDADVITERVALERTRKIIGGHPVFFDALADFARKPNRKVVYVMGNHDFGVAWPRVQQLLKERLGADIRFLLDCYEEEGVYVEHGNQFLYDNRLDLDNLFLTRGQAEPLLKMPWGGFFAIHVINGLRRERPYIGKVFPFRLYLRWSLVHDMWFAIKTILRLFLFFVKINVTRDPRRNFSVFDTWKILKEFKFPLELDNEAKKILFRRPGIHLVSFGHTHHARYRQFAPDKEYMNTGSWNELIGLDLGNLGNQLAFTFVEIEHPASGTLRARLKEWKGSYEVCTEIFK